MWIFLVLDTGFEKKSNVQHLRLSLTLKNVILLRRETNEWQSRALLLHNPIS